MKNLWRKFWCSIGFHKRLQTIQKYGSAERAGCPYCLRTIGIHHGMRAALPWDADIEKMYQEMGYDTEEAYDKWLLHVRPEWMPRLRPSIKK